jgi:hypothetical protein
MGLKALNVTLTIHHRLVTTLNKYEWSYTSPSPIRLHCAHRNNFTVASSPPNLVTLVRYLPSAHTQSCLVSSIYAVCSLSDR